MKTRQIAMGTNALASSIVLVCRKRAHDAPTIGRRDFLRELNATLPQALLDMTHGGINSPVAPVDLSQAIIGPGMAIFSQYAAVLEADGTPMSVGAITTPIANGGSGNPPQVAKTRFYGTVSLDPIQAKKQFAVLVDEVILQFTKDARVNVRIAIEISADSAPGFDLALQRAVKENCNVLDFKSAEFEE